MLLCTLARLEGVREGGRGDARQLQYAHSWVGSGLHRTSLCFTAHTANTCTQYTVQCTHWVQYCMPVCVCVGVCAALTTYPAQPEFWSATCKSARRLTVDGTFATAACQFCRPPFLFFFFCFAFYMYISTVHVCVCVCVCNLFICMSFAFICLARLEKAVDKKRRRRRLLLFAHFG